MHRLIQTLTMCIAMAVACLNGAPAADAETPPAQHPGADGLARLGILHPAPHLCTGEEATQRDVRVLRLAYGVALTPAQRMAWPWFLHADSARVTVDTAALWPLSAGGSGLARWLERVVAQVPALEASGEALPDAAGRWPALRIRAGDPWLAGRLNGSSVLPFREEPGAADPCRGWPAGIEYRPGRGATDGAGVRYVLRRLPGPAGFGFALYGFESSQALWAAFASGRIDLALADSESLRQDVPPARWATTTGTLQVILRWSPRLQRSLSPAAMLDLSLAINRPALAGAAGRGAFRAARAFFEPLVPDAQAPDPALTWDSRLARQNWLARGAAGPVERLRLAVLSHALLEAIALRLAGQWQATLGVSAVPERVDADRLLQAWNAGSYDAMVDVVDLDDGSLQDLWSAARLPGQLAGERPRQARSAADAPSADDLTGWEARLARELPYVPLLTHMQVYAARGGTGTGLLQRICPTCALGSKPPSEGD
ncbi:MAG: hypothetical protein ACHQZQ_02365 [SAR324 cluster bacterium]